MWNELATVSTQIEALQAFPELCRAYGEGLIDQTVITPEKLDEIERGSCGVAFRRFADRHPRITDVAAETRWWAGFHPEVNVESAEVGASGSIGGPGEGAAAVAADKVGRNDPCPCGSGKKFKKCCGK